MTAAEKMKTKLYKTYNQTHYGIFNTDEEVNIDNEPIVDNSCDEDFQSEVIMIKEENKDDEEIIEEYLDEELITIKEEIVEMEPPTVSTMPVRIPKMFSQKDPLLPSTSSIFSKIKIDLERRGRMNVIKEKKGLQRKLVRDNFTTKVFKGVEVYSCKTCDKTFMKKDGISLHVKTHIIKNKTHVCEECGKAFKFFKSYKVHIRRHEIKKGLVETFSW